MASILNGLGSAEPAIPGTWANCAATKPTVASIATRPCLISAARMYVRSPWLERPIGSKPTSPIFARRWSCYFWGFSASARTTHSAIDPLLRTMDPSSFSGRSRKGRDLLISASRASELVRPGARTGAWKSAGNERIFLVQGQAIPAPPGRQKPWQAPRRRRQGTGT